ncbi:MAG: hypothetical protein ACP5OG_05920 [Candidatus Nanoarchaeia archaeon]
MSKKDNVSKKTAPNASNVIAPATPAETKMSAEITEVVSAAVTSSAWETYITPFATAIGKNIKDINDALKSLVGEPGEAAIALLQNEEDTPISDITDALKNLGVPKAVLNKAIRGLRKVQDIAGTDVSPALAANPAYNILPVVPDDTSFLEMLRVGGVSKVGAIEFISAIRAALADKKGLYDILTNLQAKMKQFAESQEEPCGPEYFRLKKLIARRSYAEIFAALDLDTTSIPKDDKDALLEKLESTLWNALNQFHSQVVAWMDSWNKNAANPGMLGVAIAAAVSGGRSGIPSGMMQPPATNVLRSGAEGVINRINKIFAGTGIVTARALAYDASNIKAILETPSLPAQIGAANRDQMLKMLNVDVSSDYVLLEQNLTRYALGVMELVKQTCGDNEIAYISALYTLGNAIPWETLNSFGSDSSPNRRTSKY